MSAPAVLHMVRKAPPQPVDDALWTDKRLAVHLDLHPDTLRQWRCAGTGPQFIKLPGGGIRYRSRDVLAWEAARLRKSTSDTGE